MQIKFITNNFRIRYRIKIKEIRKNVRSHVLNPT